MSALRATLEPVVREHAAQTIAPGDAEIEVRIVNDSPGPELFHDARARHGSLVLQVEDESGRRVLLPPPAPPDERDLAAARHLAPGESVTLRYTGFLDARCESGRYRVRWFSPHQTLGGSLEAPLASDWIVLDIVGRKDPRLPRPRMVRRLVDVVVKAVARLWRYLAVLFCIAVLEREVDVAITETITDGYPPEWNNTYGWHARFHVQVDQPKKRIVVTIRIRLIGVSASVATTWLNTVEAAWSNRFKACISPRCGSDGFPIFVVLLYVTSGEHQIVTFVSPPQRTASMTAWGSVDADQAHEVGHMLGNKEEYFTVDGVPYGPGRQPTGNIMNNPDNPPVPAHYWLIQTTFDALLWITYSFHGGTVKPLGRPCI